MAVEVLYLVTVGRNSGHVAVVGGPLSWSNDIHAAKLLASTSCDTPCDDIHIATGVLDITLLTVSLE